MVRWKMDDVSKIHTSIKGHYFSGVQNHNSTVFSSTHSMRLHRRPTTMYSPRAILCLLAALPALPLAERCDVYVDGEVLRDLALPRADISAPPTVDLYVHIVAGSESREDGYLTVTPNTTP